MAMSHSKSRNGSGDLSRADLETFVRALRAITDDGERVNASVSTIEQHYVKAAPEERRKRLRDRMEDPRRSLVNGT